MRTGGIQAFDHKRANGIASAMAAALVALFMLGGSAHAKLSTHDQTCIDAYNNKLRLVSQQARKSARTCIKNAGKGRESNVDQCVIYNSDDKLAGKEGKVAALFDMGGKCDPVPAVIVQDAATGNAAHRGAILNLMHDMFGDPIDYVYASMPPAMLKCQDKVVRQATQYFTTSIKVFDKCAKEGRSSV